jgi:hypothetical protein
MSEEMKKCVLVGPGHNFPAKLRLGRLRKYKLSGSYIEPRGNDFILHTRCIRIPSCGQSLIFEQLSNPGLFQPSSKPRDCRFCQSYFTHDSALLENALEASGHREFYEVQTRKLDGIMIYIPQVKKYFWLAQSPSWFNTDCSYSSKPELNKTK